jgi:hypothetical protein
MVSEIRRRRRALLTVVIEEQLAAPTSIEQRARGRAEVRYHLRDVKTVAQVALRVPGGKE